MILGSLLADEISVSNDLLSWLIMPTERGVCFPPYEYSVLCVTYMFHNILAQTHFVRCDPLQWFAVLQLMT